MKWIICKDIDKAHIPECEEVVGIIEISKNETSRLTNYLTENNLHAYGEGYEKHFKGNKTFECAKEIKLW